MLDNGCFSNVNGRLIMVTFPKSIKIIKTVTIIIKHITARIRFNKFNFIFRKVKVKVMNSKRAHRHYVVFFKNNRFKKNF